jgi:hypothetical protein
MTAAQPGRGGTFRWIHDLGCAGARARSHEDHPKLGELAVEVAPRIAPSMLLARNAAAADREMAVCAKISTPLD